MNLYATSHLINAFFSFLIGVFVYSRDKNNQTNITFALMCTSLAGWCFFYFVWQLQTMPEQALFFLRTLLFFNVFCHSFFLHFVLSVTNTTKKHFNILLITYASSLILAFTVYTPFYVNDPGHAKLLFRYWPNATLLSTITFLTQIITVIYGLYILFTAIKSATGHSKTKFIYLFVCFAIAWPGGFFNWLLWYNIMIPPIGNFLITLYLTIIAYAIVRHKVLDIEFVVRKGLIYSILLTLVSVSYLVLIFLLEATFRVVIGYKSTFIALLIMIVLTLISQPLKNKIKDFVDKFFFKGSIYQIQEENVRLREELQRAEKLKAISTLAAGMAHEIKNPLTSIKTFTEYLPKKCDDKDFIEKFTRIVGAEVEKINDIVGQLLYFAKPRPPQISPSDIGALINETIDLLNNDFIKYNVKVARDIPNSVILSIDPVQMKQVFLNLIINAIDAMKSGGGTLKVSVISEQEIIKISFEDTGAGISQKNIKNVFDPFFSTKDTSTGLGLSIVHGIISNHNGRIEVVSAPGKGTRFDILLPC